jgi:hypothetical protein
MLTSSQFARIPELNHGLQLPATRRPVSNPSLRVSFNASSSEGLNMSQIRVGQRHFNPNKSKGETLNQTYSTIDSSQTPYNFLILPMIHRATKGRLELT